MKGGGGGEAIATLETRLLRLPQFGSRIYKAGIALALIEPPARYLITSETSSLMGLASACFGRSKNPDFLFGGLSLLRIPMLPERPRRPNARYALYIVAEVLHEHYFKRISRATTSSCGNINLIGGICGRHPTGLE